MFGALKSDSIHHFFRNACTKSGSLRFSQFSGCWLILSVYILMSFDFSLWKIVRSSVILLLPLWTEFISDFSGVCIIQSLPFYVVFCRSWFVLLSFICWSLCCLSFYLWLTINSLVSSNFFLEIILLKIRQLELK